MSNHTPGPWHRNIRANGKYPVVFAGRNTHVATAAQFPQNPEETEANIDLIAAAPDLLEALRDMYAGWQYIRSFHGDLYGVGWDRCDEKASAAIAKATAG